MAMAWMRRIPASACRRRLPALDTILLGGLIGLIGVAPLVMAQTAGLHIPSTKVTLANGLTVVVSEKHELPIAHVSVRFKAGSVYDPEDKAGLADLTTRLLDKGTATRSAREIAEELDFLGARFDASAGGTGSTASLSVLGKDVERGLDLLADLLQHPQFELAELERERRRMLSQIQQRRVNPRSAVAETFRELLYAGHPLHRPVSGYAPTVSQIARDDVLAFHRRFFVPNNAILVMVGDLPAASMIALIDRAIGRWSAAPLDTPAIPPPTPVQAKQVRVVDMDVNQSYIQFGHLGVRRADPEFPTLRAMNYILGGGGFVSRLTRSIREEQGLAYSVFSEFVGGSRFPGFFVAGMQTRIDTTSQALSSLFTVLEGMKQEPVTAAELTDMKQYFEGSLPRRAETYQQVAGLLIDREFYGLPDGYWNAEIQQIQQLTADDILRAARRHLDTERFVLALASKRQQLTLRVDAIPAEAISYAPAP
jgi:zinc protease